MATLDLTPDQLLTTTRAVRKRLDYAGWTPHVAPGGLLAVHDVFTDPAEGGRPPYEEIYLPALASGRFVEVDARGSLRVLRRSPG